MTKTTEATLLLDAPFPYFGGKRTVAADVWQRLGDTPNYCEPFFGSGAMLLKRPAGHTGHIETVNDKDGYVANFWRASSCRNLTDVVTTSNKCPDWLPEVK